MEVCERLTISIYHCSPPLPNNTIPDNGKQIPFVYRIAELHESWFHSESHDLPSGLAEHLELVEMTKTGYHYEEDNLNIMKRFSVSPPAIMIEDKAFSMDIPDVNEEINNKKTQGLSISPYSNYTGIYPTLPLYPSEMETVNHIHLPRVSMEPWSYHL
ncbi:Hypothetical predicted protein [Pelobates cultripes]|uniref:Uncharacterized protein n=1 Tax=Pelobates cultripes TaxID=61616 RepID=A0AAD1WRK7_PELCU|nr:Hypothetical predicted protein [Pelobates cultripes]